MLIPVCHIVRRGTKCGTVSYDTEGNQFLDSAMVEDRSLPVQDYMSCEVTSDNMCTAVGVCSNTGMYVVCFGDNMLYAVTAEQLNNYNITNVREKIGGVRWCARRGLPDLSSLFPEAGLSFVDVNNLPQQATAGVSRKFFGIYKGTPCVVKVSRGGPDVRFEELYYKIGTALGIPVCPAKTIIYGGKECSLSLYQYDMTKDVFVPFKQLGKSTSEIYANLEYEDKVTLDKMLLLDYLMSQEDRHAYNLALCNGKMYPLFDNGSCLGIGAISMQSEAYRAYIDRLKITGRLNDLGICLTDDLLTEIKQIFSDNELFNKFMINARRLDLCRR